MRLCYARISQPKHNALSNRPANFLATMEFRLSASADDDEAVDEFGRSVAIYRTTAIVGEPLPKGVLSRFWFAIADSYLVDQSFDDTSVTTSLAPSSFRFNEPPRMSISSRALETSSLLIAPVPLRSM